MRVKWFDAHPFLKKKTAAPCLEPKKVYSLLITAAPEHLPLSRWFGENYALLSTENSFLPYLSLQENLLINSSMKEKKQRQQLQQWLTLVQLKPVLLSKKLTALTPYEKIKCQLIQLALSKKQLIIVTEIFNELTVAQTQQLLPLFQKVACQADKQILLLTSEAAIADNIYVDIKLTTIDELLAPPNQ